MKKIITLMLIISIALIANQKEQFKHCTETSVDQYTTIFYCGQEQYLVEYTNEHKNNSNKITLINNGKAVVLKGK